MNQLQTLTDLSASFLKLLVKESSPFSQQNSSSLVERKFIYLEFFGTEYQKFREKMAIDSLKSTDANEIVSTHTAWMDAWIQYTWNYVVEERHLLMEELLNTSDEKLIYIKKNLPRKKKRKRELEAFLFAEESEKPYMDPAERSYYLSRLKEIQVEIEELQKEKEAFRQIIPKFKKNDPDIKNLLRALLIFARGGYGRGELTFSSDIDVGYCLNTVIATGLEIQTV